MPSTIMRRSNLNSSNSSDEVFFAIESYEIVAV
jgi:hypothetical protein